MKTQNYILPAEKAAEELLEICKDAPQSENMLVQIFSGRCEEDFLRELQKTISELFPTAAILGCTTSGEILDDEMYEKSTIISISTFENTKINPVFVPINDEINSKTAGIQVAKKLSSQNTKAIISFGTGLTLNGEDFLQGVEAESPGMIIAGGLAGDNLVFSETFVFSRNEFSTKGVVAVGLENPELQVHRDYNFNWQNIGKKMAITKSEGGKIYEIDGIPATEIYKKYLGIHASVLDLGMEFPLIVWRSGIKIARALIAVDEKEGSITLAGKVNEGEQVQFGFGNTTTILGNATRIRNSFCSQPVESLFIYSCCARCSLLGKSILGEVRPLADLAPTAGFFTYGEFYHSDEGNVFFNDTMTVLALSEEKSIPDESKCQLPKIELGQETMGLNAITHLAKVVTEELVETNNSLEEKVEEQTSQLRKSYEKLKELDRSKDEFIALSSHELRTPLTVAQGYSELLLSGKFGEMNEKQKGFLEKMEKNIIRLVSMVNDMVHISELEIGEIIFAKEEILLEDFLRKKIEKEEKAFQEKGIELRFQNTENYSGNIMFDRKWADYVIEKLLQNALKFTEQGNATLSIGVSQEEGKVLVSIQDSGVGIAPEKRAVIFEKFNQSEGHLQRNFEGAGLGLSVIKSVLEKQNASISVESEVGKGTTFHVSFPTNG